LMEPEGLARRLVGVLPVDEDGDPGHLKSPRQCGPKAGRRGVMNRHRSNAHRGAQSRFTSAKPPSGLNRLAGDDADPTVAQAVARRLS
jgi:hypothetical protein